MATQFSYSWLKNLTGWYLEVDINETKILIIEIRRHTVDFSNLYLTFLSVISYGSDICIVAFKCIMLRRIYRSRYLDNLSLRWALNNGIDIILFYYVRMVMTAGETSLFATAIYGVKLRLQRLFGQTTKELQELHLTRRPSPGDNKLKNLLKVPTCIRVWINFKKINTVNNTVYWCCWSTRKKSTIASLFSSVEWKQRSDIYILLTKSESKMFVRSF